MNKPTQSSLSQLLDEEQTTSQMIETVLDTLPEQNAWNPGKPTPSGMRGRLRKRKRPINPALDLFRAYAKRSTE